ncbi:alkaline phosphatase synthesis sensor protein PhoR [Clostridiales bacterium]|nr:alkaline phosphatase synthesis sensor protein PhoR [Clostridiales bacterium]
MFKKSRRKIVAAIMSILVLLWVGTLSVIYASSYFEMAKQNEQMLQAHAEMYVLPQSFEGMMPPNKPIPGGNPGFHSDFDPQSPMFQLSTFYTVAVSYDGDIIEIKNEPPTVHTDDELEKLAQSIIKNNKAAGTVNNLAFYKTDKGGYTLVTFMDNTVVNESAMTLFRYTLIFGGVALILFFFLSVFLARKIVNPLAESYQKQKQFISDAGHELKTPVSVVSANAELLFREIGDNQWLQNIQYENQRMGMLVGQLLDLARTENVTSQMEHIDFSRLVTGEALPFESVAFEKGLVLNSNIASDIGVEGNGTQLKQIVSILLDNAICHSREQGEVCLSLKKEHGFAKLSVINKGDEIPVEQREQIFERFYRVDAVRNGEDKHYGLGLAIAKAIVTSHKGRIEVLCYNGLVEFRVQIPAL